MELKEPFGQLELYAQAIQDTNKDKVNTNLITRLYGKNCWCKSS